MNTLIDEATTEAAADRVRLADGRALGRYRIVRVLGEGGMGVVYEALHQDLRKRVAIKVLKPELVADETAQRRFLREGEAAARVRHPHVVDVSDVGNHAGLPFLVMELLEGEDLEALLRRERRLGVERALDLILPVAAGVAAGHDHGVIHCDLKPQNIFLCRQAGGGVTPKVLDFGVSKLLDAQGVRAHLTAAGAIFGTVQYFAPEQARGGSDVGPRSDQYTLAAILSECLTGERVFPGENALDILRRICQAEFTPPRALRADLAPALEAVILRAMSLEPSARFASLYGLGAALLPFSSLKTQLIWETTFKSTAAAVAPTVSDAERNAPPSVAAPSSEVPRTQAQPVTAPPPPVAAQATQATQALQATQAPQATIDVSDTISDVYDEEWDDDTDGGAAEDEASPLPAAAWSDSPDPVVPRSGQTLLLPPDALVTQVDAALVTQVDVAAVTLVDPAPASTRRLSTERLPAPPAPAPERARATEVVARAVTARTPVRSQARRARIIGTGALGLLVIGGVWLLRSGSPPPPVEPSPAGAAAHAPVEAPAPRVAPPLEAPVPAEAPRAVDSPPVPPPPPSPPSGSVPAFVDRAAEASPARATPRHAASAPSREPSRRVATKAATKTATRATTKATTTNARPRIQRTINHAPVVD